MQRMTTLLNEKESSLRKLKETLRKSQQQGEDSCKTTLSVCFFLIFISDLDLLCLTSLVSSQQAELSKWKSRAIKLKGKSKAEVDKPSSPCTPTKRAFPMTSDSSHLLSSPKKCPVAPKKNLDSPRKALESPRKLLDSPKSGFFNIGGSSELLSRTCPKKFFDNSSLGIIPGKSFSPAGNPNTFMKSDVMIATYDARVSISLIKVLYFADAVVGANKTEEWWPQSPKQEEMCKTQ
uniref:Uncharacterized protein n=1 Tax=Acanthochromis polyacanthus TaxID=80966 RepID=A0A3Q1FNM5_9TELE